jgi:hypothetical protein
MSASATPCPGFDTPLWCLTHGVETGLAGSASRADGRLGADTSTCVASLNERYARRQVCRQHIHQYNRAVPLNVAGNKCSPVDRVEDAFRRSRDEGTAMHAIRRALQVIGDATGGRRRGAGRRHGSGIPTFTAGPSAVRGGADAAQSCRRSGTGWARWCGGVPARWVARGRWRGWRGVGQAGEQREQSRALMHPDAATATPARPGTCPPHHQPLPPTTQPPYSAGAAAVAAGATAAAAAAGAASAALLQQQQQRLTVGRVAAASGISCPRRRNDTANQAWCRDMAHHGAVTWRTMAP